MRIFAITACFCVLLAGCDRTKTDKTKVFFHYFHTGPPKDANIITASNWEAYDGPILDEWKLILDAELSRDFLDAHLPIPVDAKAPADSSIESLFGMKDSNHGVEKALGDHPLWFKPENLSHYSVITSDVRLSSVTGFAVVIFASQESTNRFQLWVANNGWNRLFVDRQTGRVFAYDKFP